MTLSQIVNVSITQQTTAVSQAGFGAANFLSNNAVFQERIKVYTSLASVQADDLVGADTVLFATKYFGQAIRPTQLYVTKTGRDLPRVQTIDLDADLIASNTASVKINGGTAITATFATDHDTTLAAWAASIQSDAAVTTATVTGARQITVTGATADAAVALTELSVTGGASQAGVTNTVTQYEDEELTDVASLTEAVEVNDDWYALGAYQRTKADILLIAAWIEAKSKIYGFAVSDSDVLTSATDDVASELQDLSYSRTFCMYSADQANYPEAAWFGSLLPYTPGEATWKFKTLAGITVDTLTPTEVDNAKGKNANVYTTVGGVNITSEGKMAGGDFIDVTRGVDWTQARVQENVYSALVNEVKIPFTDDGVSIVVNRVRQILTQGVQNGLFAADPEPSVTAPLVANVSTANRANRTLPDVEFSATLAGAIHSVTIAGVVSV